MKHALKLESIDLTKEVADGIINKLQDFAEQLGYSKDRISELECRRRDGFIPHSYNLGGIECVAFRDQYLCCENTGFENTDKTLTEYWKYDFDYVQSEKNWPKDYADWSDEQREYLDETRQNDDQATVMYSMDCMYTGFENSMHKVNLRICVCAKDSPYHRQYDDLIDIDVEFKTVSSLHNKLQKLLKRLDLKQFSSNLLEAY